MIQAQKERITLRRASRTEKDWDKGGVEEPDERKELDPEIWDAPGELDERGEDDENDGLFPLLSFVFPPAAICANLFS